VALLDRLGPVAAQVLRSDLVSVVIPCYGQAKFLDDCVAALQSQTWTQWEAVIVNDGSPDDAAAVGARLERAEPRVKLVNQANAGRSAARNAGLRVACGEFVQFLDADDALEPAKLGAHVQYLRNHPQADATFGSAWYFRSDNPAERSRSYMLESDDADWIERLAQRPEPLAETLIARNTFPICAPLIRRSALDRAGHFDESLRTAEDWELWLRCTASGLRFAYCPGPGTSALIRVHPESVTHDRPEMLEGALSMRIRSLRYVRSPAHRRANLLHAVYLLQRMPAALRPAGYARLVAATHRGDERIAAWLAGVANEGTVGRLLRPVARVALPWRWRFLLA